MHTRKREDVAESSGREKKKEVGEKEGAEEGKSEMHVSRIPFSRSLPLLTPLFLLLHLLYLLYLLHHLLVTLVPFSPGRFTRAARSRRNYRDIEKSPASVQSSFPGLDYFIILSESGAPRHRDEGGSRPFGRLRTVKSMR